MSTTHLIKTSGDISLGIPNQSLGLNKGGSSKALNRGDKGSSMNLKS